MDFEILTFLNYLNKQKLQKDGKRLNSSIFLRTVGILFVGFFIHFVYYSMVLTHIHTRNSRAVYDRIIQKVNKKCAANERIAFH